MEPPSTEYLTLREKGPRGLDGRHEWTTVLQSTDGT